MSEPIINDGDIVFCTIAGGAGAVVAAGQLLLAAGERGWVWDTGVKEWWRKRHVGVAVWHEGLLCIVQAMPGGVEMVPLDVTGGKYTILRPNYSITPGDLNQAKLVARAAMEYIGTPYDFATYAAIPAYRRGLRTQSIEEIISGIDTMMCSRMVDAALDFAHYHLFDDGRLPGNVTPSELYRQLKRQGATTIVKGG